MHWYNPEEGKVEDGAPTSSDEEELGMLSGLPDSDRLVECYVVLREEGLGVEQALAFVVHSLRMFRPRHPNLGRTLEP